jgi:DNA modification methylase
MATQILVGDCRALLATLPERSVQTCVTSPPYFGLRDYGNDSQIGLEPTPDEYVAELVGVFREVRRVLRDDGTLWLNLGDSYATTGKKGSGGVGNGSIAGGKGQATNAGSLFGDVRARRAADMGLKDKDLIGIPWLVAFALRAHGWYLRSDIIWHKPNPMPESVTDRPTKAHEYLFLFSKSSSYYYDADAIAEAVTSSDSDVRKMVESRERIGGKTLDAADSLYAANASTNIGQKRAVGNGATRNRRSVWTVATTPYSGAHFATFPPALIEPCILAGSNRGDTVLDPFGGAGTTGLVADRHGRDAILCELNPAYARLARRRITRGMARDDVAAVGAAAVPDDHGPLFAPESAG